MVKKMSSNGNSDSDNSRSPLKDVTGCLRRSSRRAGGIKKGLQEKASAKNLASGLKNATVLLCKVESIEQVGKRRKVSTSKYGASPKKKKPKLNDQQKGKDDLFLKPQPMVCVPAYDVWLCEPTLAQDIYLYTKSLENCHLLSANYLSESGARVTNEMRATLVSWLVEIHGHLKLEPETLHIAVKLLDTTLSRFNVGVTRLQLCGLAVFWIASKLENSSLHAKDLLQLMCYTGDASILVQMEEQVLKVLDFQVQVADPVFFLNRLLLYDEHGDSQELRNTCNYCMDSLLHEVSVVEIKPSEMASAALLAARYLNNRTDWPLPLAYATGHWPTPAALRPLATKMILAIQRVDDVNCPYSGAYRKYSSNRRFYGLSKSAKFRADHLTAVVVALASC